MPRRNDENTRQKPGKKFFLKEKKEKETVAVEAISGKTSTTG